MKSMCSPLGNATINSLINVATFLLEITSHSHSLTPSTGLVDFDAHVALHLHLAAQTPVVLNLLTAEVRYFGRQNLAATLYNLAFALSARALATASRGKEDAVDRQRIQQRSNRKRLPVPFRR